MEILLLIFVCGIIAIFSDEEEAVIDGRLARVERLTDGKARTIVHLTDERNFVLSGHPTILSPPGSEIVLTLFKSGRGVVAPKLRDTVPIPEASPQDAES